MKKILSKHFYIYAGFLCFVVFVFAVVYYCVYVQARGKEAFVNWGALKIDPMLDANSPCNNYSFANKHPYKMLNNGFGSDYVADTIYNYATSTWKTAEELEISSYPENGKRTIKQNGYYIVVDYPSLESIKEQEKEGYGFPVDPDGFSIYDINSKLLYSTKNEKDFSDTPKRFLSLSYKGVNYSFIEIRGLGWHGGNRYVSIVEDGGKVAAGKTPYFSYGLEDVILASDGVYFTANNTDFGYFLTSWSDSGYMFYPRAYKIDKNTGEFISKDVWLKNNYSEYFKMYGEEVERLKTEKFDDKDAQTLWPVMLTARSLFEILSGGNEKIVVEKFETDFAELSKKYGSNCFIDKPLEEIKKDFLDRIHQRNQIRYPEPYNEDGTMI